VEILEEETYTTKLAEQEKAQTNLERWNSTSRTKILSWQFAEYATTLFTGTQKNRGREDGYSKGDNIWNEVRFMHA